MDLHRERELITRAKKDPEAFSKLYDVNYPKILGFTLKRVGDLDVAQDICSETFLKALKNIKNFEWQGISCICWLYKIASNEITEHFRKRKKAPIDIESVKEPATKKTPVHEVIKKEKEIGRQKKSRKLKEHVLDLPSDYREVIHLKFFEKKKIKEITKITGKKQGTVKSLIHRGLRKLEKKLKS